MVNKHGKLTHNGKDVISEQTDLFNTKSKQGELFNDKGTLQKSKKKVYKKKAGPPKHDQIDLFSKPGMSTQGKTNQGNKKSSGKNFSQRLEQKSQIESRTSGSLEHHRLEVKSSR